MIGGEPRRGIARASHPAAKPERGRSHDGAAVRILSSIGRVSEGRPLS